MQSLVWFTIYPTLFNTSKHIPLDWLYKNADWLSDWYTYYFTISYITRQSVDGASRLDKKIPIITLQECILELFYFYSLLKTTCKKLFVKYQCNARFPSLCLAPENTFFRYFYSKNAHNSVENHRIWIKFKLAPKTTCYKLFLKCEDNARFPSLSLASENAFLSYFYSKNGHNNNN